ncbi:MAG: lysophospholipid acyltransferase family protein [Rubrobacteraceae bacterium]
MPTLSPTGMSRRYALFRRVVLALGRFFLGFTVHGEEKVPPKGAVIIAANHHRLFDPVFVCMAVPRRVQWMAKKELFIPILRKFINLIGAFPVDREGGGRSALRAALGYLAEGWALGIFPEGTRQKNKDPGEPKSGAIMLAVRSNAPVLPVFIGRVPPPSARLKGEKLHAYIGDPMTMDNAIRGGVEYRQSAERVLKDIYALPEKR